VGRVFGEQSDAPGVVAVEIGVLPRGRLLGHLVVIVDQRACGEDLEYPRLGFEVLRNALVHRDEVGVHLHPDVFGLASHQTGAVLL
jgi:hypothetical protein